MNAATNDRARRALGLGCMLVQTPGVSSLPQEKQSTLREMVEKFDSFTEDNDPYKEHDFGKMTLDKTDYFWKIDDYGPDFRKEGATRPLVLTLMRADEY
jgi:hypothetical protein